LDWQAGLAGTEQRRGCGLAFQERSAEVSSETSHRLDGYDEAMDPALPGSVDEPDVIFRIDLQPVQNRWEGIRNAAALAFDDRAAGPVGELDTMWVMRWTPPSFAPAS